MRPTSTRNTLHRLVHTLAFSGALQALAAAVPPTPAVTDLSLAQQYWLALNSGRDLTPFEKIAREALSAENRAGLSESFNNRRSEVLALIQATPTRPEVKGEGTDDLGRPGHDWPGLGGNPQHTGATADQGPTRGLVQWRFPVGFDYRSGVHVAGDYVIAVSPGTETTLYAFERSSGTLAWVNRRPAVSRGLAPRTGGEIQTLSNGLLCVPEVRMNGRSMSFLLVDATSGETKNRVLATPSEAKFSPPEGSAELKHAYIAATGSEVSVKVIPTGRMWWTFPTGPLRSEPVTADSRVFVGTLDGRLWALNLENANRVAWMAKIDGALAAPLAVNGGVVYGAANDGALYAWDAGTGKQLWKCKIATSNPRTQQLFTEPVINAGSVYVGAADGHLYCVNASSGSMRWRLEIGDWIRARPFVGGGRIVVGTLAGEMVAVTVQGQKAEIQWRNRLSEHAILGAIAGDDSGYWVTDNLLWLYSLKLDGSIRWKQRLIPSRDEAGANVLADAPPDIRQSPPTVSQGRVFTGGADRFVHCVDARTGRALWRFEINGRLAAAPTVAGDLVIVGEYFGDGQMHSSHFSGDGVLTALDSKTGLPVWTRQLGGVWASPEYANGELYVGTTEGKFYRLQASTGEVKWSWQGGKDIYSAPALDDRRVYFGAWDGYYYALDRKSGELAWAWSPPGYPYQLGGRPDSAAPVLSDGRLIAPINGARYVALDCATGKELWSWRPERGVCNITATVNGQTAIVSTFGDTYVQPYGVRCYALDAATGRLKWELPHLGGLSSPVITGSGLFIGGSLTHPYIEAYRFDPTAAPQLVWRVRTQGNMAESLPAVSGDLAFFLSNDGWLRAIR